MESLAVRNKNPGNIKDPATGTFRKFNTPQEGYDALKKDLEIKVTGRSKTGVKPTSSLYEFASIYAPASDNNDPKRYAENLASQLGVTPDTPIASLSSRLDDFAGAIAQNEDKTMAGMLKQATSQPLANAQTGSLAQKIKAKYPQYADMNDAELEQKILAKYPQYGDMASQSAPSTGYPAPPEVKPYEAPRQTSGQNQVPQEDKNIVQKGLEFLFPILEKKERTPLQTVGDVGLSALTLLPGAGLVGLGAKGAKAGLGARGLFKGSNIAKGVGIGYGADVGTKLSEGETDLGEVTRPGVGTLAGGAIGGAGTLLKKASEFLPERIVRQYIPGTSEDVAKYASTKILGSPKKMLEASDSEIKTLGGQLDTMLANPKFDYIQPAGTEILDKVAQAFPGSGMTAKEVAENIKRILPLKKELVDKLVMGKDLTLRELHSLNSALGKATFKTVLDDPAVKAGKEVGSATYHEISNIIKTAVPESVPIFEKLSMEYPLRKALEKAVRSGDKRKALGLYEIIALVGGSVAHPLAGIPAAVGISAARNPTVNLMTAEALKRSQGAIPGLLGTSTIAPASRGLIELTRP